MSQKVIGRVFALVTFFGVVLIVSVCQAADPSAARKPFGLEKRVPWTTSAVRGSPDPPSPYTIEPAFPKLKFDEPLDLNRAPGVDRMFVVERFGRVLSFRTDRPTDKADLLLDLNQVLGRTSPKTVAAYGIAAHPQFIRNGYVYVTYVIDLEKELPIGTRLSRFQVLPGEPPRCDPKSERILLEWPCGGHNGGCLQFGPDGFLYVATGDSSGIADQYLTGQDLGSLAGKILRIDVDHPGNGKPYRIPSDNPFVGVEKARPEVWAYGLRQPWKMSFDRATGELWTGNVGQDLWEQIYRIERGGNYGWSVMEGSHPFRPERPRGPTAVVMPIVEHDHANFRSITGGFVYRGKRLPDLAGAYIYGDYDTGRIWMLRYNRQSNTVTDHRELYDSSLRLVGFGEDSAGEIYLLDHVGGRLSRLVPNPVANTADRFPRRLSQTGLFANTREHQPAPGVLPYSVIAPQWTDGATKERFLALPGDARIEFESITYPQPAPGSLPGWKFPNGTVIAETLFLRMDAASPASRKRIETRILHNERLSGGEDVGDQYWQGYTYVWNDEQSDAVLLEDPSGSNRTFEIADPSAPGGRRKQTWHFPSRTECTVCHNMAAKYVLGLQTVQVNRDRSFNGVLANQIDAFAQLGLFKSPLPASADELPRLASYTDNSLTLDLRARAYLHANCSHCHRKWGGGNTEFQLLAALDLAETGTIGVRPAHGAFNIANARLVAPRDPYRSVLLYRMAKLGTGRMPRIGSDVVDEDGVKLIHDWIAGMSGAGLLGDAAARASDRLALEVGKLSASPANSGGELQKRIDPLLGSTAGALRLAHAAGTGNLPTALREAILARGAGAESADVRDLFERFLPEDKRIKRLGTAFRPEQILVLRGDAARGRKLFLEASGVQCRNCHRVGGRGAEVGPDLDQIGKKYDRERILDNILNPSRQIEPKYLTYVLETKQGQMHSGLLMSKDATKVILKDANNKRIELPAAEVEHMIAQQKSLMPELLLRDLTAEQVADLTTFLSALK